MNGLLWISQTKMSYVEFIKVIIMTYLNFIMIILQRSTVDIDKNYYISQIPLFGTLYDAISDIFF